MTEKQEEFIKKICEVLDYDFTDLKNLSTHEATEWIIANIDDYNYAIRNQRYEKKY